MQSQELLKKIESNLSNKRLQLSLKRLFDLLISLILLVILSPIYLLLILWIKLDSKGEAVFKQTRVGLNGTPFTIYKFRTMVKDADKMFNREFNRETLDNFVFQEKEDPRITKSGKFLRKTSLDELPQLINILKGDMSLIGPRPEIPDIANLYNDYEKIRLLMKPGVSGLAQVNGRGNLELKETIKFDVTYVETFSLWNDIKIFFKTFKVVLLREGAY
ncbi:sugar transferase [Clostridium cylindrosporum]|uniref:Galactosyl transferase CpsE n=1 Tax=Clostridium cylindrosporum DSM 605 TaxID=1121307 RepID=A0A0J8D9U1_CLOCY|nr:sugar transferase [Clostridium cylindrosporum]KMT22607.1 galactosyl transferase CpsE [Clostridium cylindrosporum DSM 605]